MFDSIKSDWFTTFLAALVFFGLVLLCLYFVPRLVRKLQVRKLALYAAFLALGVAFVYGEPLAHWLANLAYGVHDIPEPSMGLKAMAALGDAKSKAILDHWQEINASGATIEANARVGGWVPVGTASSKIILIISFYVLSYILPWVVQRVTHPAPTKWTKDDYTADFEGLPAERKFEVIGRLSLNQSIRLGCSMLAAALIQ